MINQIIEIGAADYNYCFSRKFFNLGVEIILFEPNEIFFNDLVSKCPSNVKIINKALYSHSNGVYFYNYGYAGWAQGLKCFANTHTNLDGHIENYEIWLDKTKKYVNTISYKELNELIDKNTYLSINCNGAETLLLENMTKIPQIIRTCFYCHNETQMKIATKISEWFSKNNYYSNLIRKNKESTFFEIEFIKI